MDIIKKNWEGNYAKFVPCKELGIEEDSEKCKEKWKEIDSFYDTVCNGDFIEKYIFVSEKIIIFTIQLGNFKKRPYFCVQKSKTTYIWLYIIRV